MSTFKIDYKQIRLNPQIADMLDAIEHTLKLFGIDYYLVGAVARDVWMSGIHKKTPRKTTGDIDFAVFINDKGIYDQLKQHLINHAGFVPSHDNAFVLIWKDQTQVDLMPFGAIEDENRRVTVTGTGYTTIDVPGFSEIYDEGLPQMELAVRHRFKCCTLPGIVLLKMIAWEDRPERRRDDILDISDILHHFFEMYVEEIWENHFDLFDKEDAELKSIGARVMGREMNKIARRNVHLYNRICNILELNTADVQNSRMAEIMVTYFDNTVEENRQLLNYLKQGFTE
jgi:predicted nucleotidyltransferase